MRVESRIRDELAHLSVNDRNAIRRVVNGKEKRLDRILRGEALEGVVWYPEAEI